MKISEWLDDYGYTRDIASLSSLRQVHLTTKDSNDRLRDSIDVLEKQGLRDDPDVEWLRQQVAEWDAQLKLADDTLAEWRAAL